MTQTFDEFLNKYLNEQDETFRSEYKKAKEELEELLEKQSEFDQKKRTQKHTLPQQRQRKDVKTRIAS